MDELKQAYAAHYADIMPESVWLSLTDEDRVEVEALMAQAGHDRTALPARMMDYEGFWHGLKDGYPDRPGLAWLAFTTPLKYSLLEHAPGELTLALLAWDDTHLDSMHTLFMRGTREELMFDQRLSALAAMLGNHALDPATVRARIEAVEEAWPFGEAKGEALDFTELLHHVLWDRWAPAEFSDSTLAVLEAFMRARGADWAADEYSPAGIATYRTERDYED